MVELLISVLSAAHLLAMNVASGGPLLAAHCRSTRRGNQEENRLAARRLAHQSLWAMLIGLALGGVALALPSPGMHAALSRFPGRAYWFAGVELAFSAACIAIVALAWRRLGGWLIWLLAFASSSNLLYHFPPLMAVFGHVAADANWASESLFDRPTLLQLMGRENVISLSVHFALASLAVSAVLLLWSESQQLSNRTNQGVADDAASSTELARRASLWALWPTLLQLPVGAWVLMTTNARSRDALLGGELLATTSFAGGVVAALVLMQALAAVAMGEASGSNCRRAAWLTATVVLLMTISLRHSRPRVDPKALSARPQSLAAGNASDGHGVVAAETTRAAAATCRGGPDKNLTPRRQSLDGARSVISVVRLPFSGRPPVPLRRPSFPPLFARRPPS